MPQKNLKKGNAAQTKPANNNGTSNGKKKRKLDEDAKVSDVVESDAPVKPAKKQKRNAAESTPGADVPRETGITKNPVLEDFPRGGASALTALEAREIADAVARDDDALFKDDQKDVDLDEITPKKKRKRADAGVAADSTPDVSEHKGKSINSADALTFKRLSAGMSVLAAVKEVHDMEIVMSLPNQLTGYVSITEISNKITELVEKIAENDDEDSDESALPDLRKYVAIGQLLPCVILEVEEKSSDAVNVSKRKVSAEATSTSASTRRRVELTLKPDLVNRHLEAKDLVEGMALLGSVQSQEDHGYVIDLGIAGMNGFLSNDGASEYIERVNKGNDLEVGQLVYGSVRGMDDAKRVVTLRLDGQSMTKKTVPPSHVLTFETLKPGQLVQAKIDSHLSNGLLLSFLGFFKGTVDLFHLDRTILPVDGDIDKPLANAYKANSKLRARVLYVDRERKRVGLSLKPHVVQWTLYNGFSNSNSVDVGTIIEDAKVIRMDQGQGLLLSCGGIEAAYVQMWRIADTRIDKIDKKYRVGSVHRARVIGFDYNAGLVQVSLQPRVLAMQFMKYSDLKPGMLLKGHVLKIIDNGVIVTIEDTIRGFIPKMHFADVVISKPEKKFKVGGEVKCQVISVDAGKKKLLLTARKSLMGADLPIVSKFEDAKPGMITMGVVVAVRQFGCIVRFYGDVQGLAPTAELSENTVKDPTRLFTVGQPCKCRVMRVDPRNNKLTVSFKLTPSSVAVTAGPASEHLNVGDVVSGKVIVLSKDSAVVELDGSGAHATLPKAHVSDHPSHVNRMFSLLREGSILREVVVLSKRGQRGLTVSLKPVLVSLAKSGDILQDVSNAQVGIRVPGFVKSVTDSTCFVGFFGEAFGMAKLHNMSDRYVLKGTDLYNVGQTVVAYVTEVDQEHGRMQISLKESMCFPSSADTTTANAEKGVAVPPPSLYETEYLNSIFQEREEQALVTGQRSVDELSRISEQFPVGGRVSGTIKQRIPYGLIVQLEGGMSGLITTEQVQGSGVEEEADDDKKSGTIGKTVQAKVLDVDVEKKVVDLSLKPDLVKVKKAKGSGSDQSIVKASTVRKLRDAQEKGTLIPAEVLVVKEDYVIVALPSHDYAIGYVPTRTFNSSTVPAFNKFRANQNVRVLVARISALSSESSGAHRILLVARRVEGVAQGKDLTTMASVTADMALHDAIDPEIKTLGDLRPGVAIKVLVKSVKPLQVNVVVAKDLAGRIPLHELFDHLNSDTLVKDLPNPFRAFKPGNVVKCKVVGFRRAKAFNHLPFSHTGSGQMMVELTVRTADLALPSGRLQEHDKRKGNKVIMGWPRPASFDSLKFGDVGVGFVRRVVKNSVWVHIAPDTYGRIYALELSNDPRDLTTEAIQRRFTKSSAVMCKVIGKDTNRNVLELTVKNALSKFPSTDAPVQVGQIVVGRVTKVDAVLGLRVQIGENLFGSVHLTDISDNYKTNPTKIFKVGKLLRCCVIGKNPSKSGLYDLSLRASRVGELKPEDTLEGRDGQEVERDQEDEDDAMDVDETEVIDLDEDDEEIALDKIKEDDDDDVEFNNDEDEVDEGADDDEFADDNIEDASKPVPKVNEESQELSLQDIREGMIVRGYVRSSSDKGCIVSLSKSVSALVKVRSLSDAYIKNCSAMFPPGLLVRGKILSVKGRRVDMTLKRSEITGVPSRISKLTDVKEGMKLRATVAQIIPAGLILQINDSNVRGLCHISELSDKYIKNPADVYKVGDAVKAVVRKVDPEKKKLSFGLKASYFTEQDARDDMDLDGSDDEVDESDESEGRSSDVEVINVDSDDDAISVDDDSDSDDVTREAKPLAQTTASRPKTGSSVSATPFLAEIEPLDIGTSFSWEPSQKLSSDEEENDDEEDGGDEEETGDGQKRSERKKSKRQRQRARNEEEERVSRRETQIAKQAARDEDELQLESAEDFDRVLLGEPNSSVLWIKYMAFHMQLAEVDRARDVAERALKAIGYREERERMNLWVAYMNLENMYGTQLSLLKVFERAAAANDPKAVYTQLARIYERTDKKELAEQLYKTMTKKFNESCKVWVAVANFYLKTGDIEQWRKIQQRALQSLPQRKHAKILTKFAQTEFKFGEPERGRTLFEGIISAYPKRVDIWNIYLDMEASYGDVDSTRRVFERVITIKTSSKKMKSFFKKYLEFEKRKGTPEGEQHVKEAAMAYVAKVTTA